MRHRLIPMTSLALMVAGTTASAQVLFSEDFETDQSANWTTNVRLTDGYADFYFDYGTLGIPSAPGSGGTTRGLRMMANLTSGVFGGLSVSPNGQSFTGDYILKAQIWLNFIGPAPAGGSGSTQIGGLGIGTSGAYANAAGYADGIWFAATGDGGSSADWRAYSSSVQTSYLEASGVYLAGTQSTARNNSDPYYAGFGGVAIPAAQGALWASQTGTTNVGSAGFAWHDMWVTKLGDTVTWTVDGLPIAILDASTINMGGDNILFVYGDINATSSTDLNDFLNNMIVDNVSVEAVPEPATLTVLGLGALALMRRRRK